MSGSGEVLVGEVVEGREIGISVNGFLFCVVFDL